MASGAARKRKWDQAPDMAPEQPPVLQITSAAEKAASVAKQIAHKPSKQQKKFSKNIDINSLKSRYKLTQQSFQHKIRIDTGASVTTKGKYYPDLSLATDKDPPMYLLIEADSQESLQQAMNAVDQMIDNPQLPIFDGDLIGLKGSSSRIPVGILHADVLGVKKKIEGPGQNYLKHIQVNLY
jgi:hypothetical protein